MTEPPLTSLDFPTQFQQKALDLIQSLIAISSAVFYLLDPDMNHRGSIFFNIDREVDKEYCKRFYHLDPLDPRKFHDTDDQVVTIDSQMPFHKLRQTIYYQDFMQPNNHRYVADFFFRQQGRIVAVLSCLRQESLGPYTSEELTLLRNLQPFLEYTLNAVYLPRRIGQRQSLGEKYALTQRELDVLELVITGGNNKQIAAELALGLATVKTHLIHIFKKTGVSSRTELLSTMIVELQCR